MLPPAILYTFWPRFVSVVEPFLRAHPETTVLTLRTQLSQDLIDAVSRAGGRLAILDDLIQPEEEFQIKAESQQLFEMAGSHVGTNGWFDYVGKFGLDPDFIGQLIRERSAADFPGLVRLLHILEKAHSSYAIQLTAVSEDVLSFGKTITLWSKSHRIPVLHLAHAIALARPYTVHEKLYADIIAVYGQRAAEGYLDVGVSHQAIRITGNPAWDVYSTRQDARASIRQQLVAEHGLSSEAPLVVFAPTWSANLSAVVDEHIFGNSLKAFLVAVSDLREMGVKINAVIKDRDHNLEFGQARFRELSAVLGLDTADFLYLAGTPEPWVIASDVVVSVDSNILVEAMLCATPAINILVDSGLRLGPSFDAEAGIIEAQPGELAIAVLRLLADPVCREKALQQMEQAAPRYNLFCDGKAGERVAALMVEMYDQSASKHSYIWQDCLDVPDIEATGYHGGARGDLVEQFSNSPRMLLDIGCAAGGTGALFKLKYPDSKAWGIEINKSAAAIAATRLDKVLTGKFEELDLEAEGLAKGSVDAVILADVLEHMYNPWQVMVALKPYLSPTAQIVVSIPNVRNLALMDDLSRGYFRYERLGLLDITHIRFFTYKELIKFFHETGYHVVKNTYGIDPRLHEVFNRYKDACPCDIDTGKLVLKNISLDELYELCSLQFYMLIEPGQEQLVGYEAPGQFQQAPAEIYSKLLASHQITHAEAQLYEARLEAVSRRQEVHIALYATPEHVSQLPTTIRSLAEQLYNAVRITIVSPQAAPSDFVAGDRISWHVAETPGHAALNQVFGESKADWFAVLNAGDMVVPHSLLLMLEAARVETVCQLVYCDEDRFQPDDGALDQPFFKPDFNLAYLRSLPYIGDFYLISRSAFKELGGYRAEFEGMADYDLQLRLFERFGRQGFCHVADVLHHRSILRSLNSQPTNRLVNLGQSILDEHLLRSGLQLAVQGGTLPGTYRLVPSPAAPAVPASISIVLLVRNQADRLERAVHQILERTRSVPLELIILDCLSDEGKVRAWLESMDTIGEETVRVYCADSLEQGYYRLANLAARQARGDFLLFLAADAVPLTDNWLDALLIHAHQAGVGAVGGKLISSRGEVVSAGRILGLCGHAESPGRGQRFDATGHFGRLQCAQELSALSMACLLVKRDLFEELGGFDESYIHLFGDVDFCLRLRETGRQLVWNPDALLMHEDLDFLDLAALPENERQAAFVADRDRLFHQWLVQMANDPAYNRNLSLESPEGVIETRPELTKTRLPWRPLPNMLAIPMDNAGCGNYRVIQPFGKALKENLVEGWCRFGAFNPIEVARIAPDTIFVQRHVLSQHQLALADYRRHFPQTKIVFEVDDFMAAIPDKSMHRKDLPANIGDLLARAVTYCDRLVVTTEPLRKAYANLIDDIRVIPNAIDKDIWGRFKPQRSRSNKPRVGWAGGSSHTGDLEILIPVIQALKDEVEWVFFGMFPDGMRTMISEYHGGVHFKDYAAKLASLDLDLALAPLEDNAFNECKSNLRLLEYGALGYPVIASDLTPYRCGLPVTLVGNSPNEWISAIRQAVKDPDALTRNGDELRDAVYRDWNLDLFLPQWRAAWFE